MNIGRESVVLLMNPFKPAKVAIVGVGAVGSTTAFSLLLRERVSELVLIDVNHEKAIGDASDLSHGLPFVGKIEIGAGDYQDCSDADVIIVTESRRLAPLGEWGRGPLP